MKKFTLLFVLFVFTLSLTFASASFSFSGQGNIYGAVLTGGKVEIGNEGVIIKTDKNSIRAQSGSLSFVAGKNTFLSVKVEEENVIIYLIDGKVDISSSDSVSLILYTPVTKTEVSGKWNISLVSTETEEKIYNASSSPLTAYDAIRQEYVEVEAKGVHDYFKGYVPPKKELEVTAEEEEVTVEEVVTEENVPVIVPAAPQFLSPDIKLKEVDD